MKANTKTPKSEDQKSRAVRIEMAAATGAVSGAAVGAIAGPVGVLAGALAGGAAGAAAGLAMTNDTARHDAIDAQLDRDIGVTEGDLGAADPSQPPARVGAYSAGAAGGTAATVSVAGEGPIQTGEE